MKIFHHDDLDGKCAAYIAFRALCAVEEPMTFIEINYDQSFPFHIIGPDEDVFILDYSIQPKEMDRLLSITPHVYWIDHHKTAIEKYKDYPTQICGIRRDGTAGCALAWEYFFTGVELPDAVKYVADRDVWAWEFGDETKYFCNGAELHETDPVNGDWDYIFDNVSEVIDDGALVELYKQQRNKEYLKKYSFRTRFEGHETIVVNVGMVGSEIFESVPDLPPLQVMYAYNGRQFIVSLRSTEIDVSEIAKKYGGGGHAGAAGFEAYGKLPRWLQNTEVTR